MMVSVSVLLVVLCVTVPGALVILPTLVSHSLEFIIMLVKFYAEIMCFFFRVLVEVLSCLSRFIIELVGLITNDRRPLAHEIQNVFNDLQQAAHSMRAWFYSGERPQWVITLWGFVITTVYFYFNNLRNLFASQNINRNSVYRQDPTNNVENNNEVNNNFQNRNINNSGNRRAQPQTADNNRRINVNRQNHDGSNRLYPNLSTVQPNAMNINRSDDLAHDGNLCCVCMERERDVALFPCGHTYLCQVCTVDVMATNRRCPICQRLIAEFRHVYL